MPLSNQALANVETFESFPVNTVLTTQVSNLTFSAGTGTPTIRAASSPLVPGQPNGLAHIPFGDFPDYLQINFAPGTDHVGALVDFGVVGSGVRLTAYSGPNQTGSVVGTASTTAEGLLNVSSMTGFNIISARFETLSSDSTYLIDNLSYSFLPEPTSIGSLAIGLCSLVLCGRRRRN